MKLIIELLIQILILVCIAFIIVYLILLSFCNSCYQTKNTDQALYKLCPLNYSIETNISNKKFNICFKNKKACTLNQEWISINDVFPDKEIGCYINSPCICNIPKKWKKIEYGRYICE
ncbi:hypothetical protein A2331_05770 [Candidatus Falkowbacteria bacterium RIFOXYB2_FULL_34_18]|uniref:Uncharacterized protein n=1 Tax=Candidatus Falkowbacteria bacterium RIFOXYD2_FULL_34_120 TaxID=1798007 RepID=A0A1F5TLW7_9BACT|nr:MAG: hypothetical protein A2331_05770 [Candidatus Falkowbacteria bacterium RIFOXYB2_FULL_34_18]OGF29154.1 MAG: hypothetical protein A2500_05715 [Candidatus Falkowbacteria bacterium RIFOXYC12_FULL_34_55]OGF36960.1 MAG: hypothetical protein A2466_07095 [Candidatus Falkowbacteria bacterium RIFOXYC2_FULL_34_220]OGF38676.1 MAG: hypothetical protein A2515_01380 [Candidatus Falkowbacteria bacterium RIFOXYD12_FULL_34_57]OGF39910.1 MAG: hypothetical protein A2531_01635 [Candidatus Falkowbacteria bact